MTTLLKISLPLARKIQNDPKTIERLVQRAGEVVTTIVPPEPSPRPPPTTTDSPVTAAKPSTSGNIHITPSTSIAFPPSSPSRAHRQTLEFIQKLRKNYTLKDNYVSNPMLDILRKNIRRYKPQKVIYKLFPIFSHVHP